MREARIIFGNRRPDISDAIDLLISAASQFYSRGWLLATSGNLSAVVSSDPLRIAITESGVNKGNLAPENFIELDESGNAISGKGRPSAESLIHLALVKEKRCGAVMHTHSVASTILSREYAREGEIVLSGLEMLKGLEGVNTHNHEEIVPIIENSQDMGTLARQVSELTRTYPKIHGFLLSGHGLYTWGGSIETAVRHVEALEFMLEVTLRTVSLPFGLERLKIGEAWGD